MRINTNVSALNAQRQLGITNSSVSQSITRLSSGFRINRAADDAAGLGIANKLRGDIRSMTQAARNGEQANSLAQIAEGSVSGIASMLDRMKELATQANSDTVDTGGRERLQAEFEALRSEINRTAETTQFGSTKLINGGFGTKTNGAATETFFSALDTPIAAVDNFELNGAKVGAYTFTYAAAASGTVTVVNGDVTQTITGADAMTSLDFSEFGIKVNLSAAGQASNMTGGDLNVTAGTGGQFMVGSSGAYDATTDGDLLSFSRIDMTATTLGLDDLDLTLGAAATNGAQETLTAIDAAVSLVNEALGDIGAFQNRVENAVANLKTGIENLSASESVIRDLDMAEEMTKFSKNQILQQAGTAMLAQANSASQNILQLLRG